MITLVRKGVITRAQYLDAVEKHRLEGGLIGEKLLEMGHIDGEKMQNFARTVLD